MTQFIYFDETKFSLENPYFFIGGIILPDVHMEKFESTLILKDTIYFTHSHHSRFSGSGSV